MNNPDAVLDAGIHLVEGNNIFGVMIADLHQVPHLAVRCFWKLDADLHINALVAARCNKVDLLCIVLADVNIVAAALSSSRRSLTTTSNFSSISSSVSRVHSLACARRVRMLFKILSASLIVVISNLYCGVVCWTNNRAINSDVQ